MANIESGPPGVEVPHQWNSGIVLNTLDARPRIKVDKITGRFSLAESPDVREPKTGRRGEKIYPSYPLGKTEVWEGSVQGRTLDSVMIATHDLRHAFRDRSSSGIMTILGEQQWIYTARVQQLDADSSHAEYDAARFLPWQVPFVLGLRMDDGRYYAWPTIVGAGVTVDDGDVYTFTNQGRTDTDPVVTVAVASGGTDVTITSVTLSKSLVFLDVPAGSLVVDFRKPLATIAGDDAVRYLDDDSSDWWDEGVPGIVPGDNDVTVDGGDWSIQFLPACE